MRKPKYTETKIVSILNEADAGVPVKEVCRKHGISSPTFYKWKAKYAGLGVSELKRMKGLEAEKTSSRQAAFGRSKTIPGKATFYDAVGRLVASTDVWVREDPQD